MPTLSDAEVLFYQSVLADPEGKSLNDLRYAYFLAAINGDLPAPEPSPVEVPGGIDATGTASATTYLNGAGAWSTPPNTNTTYPALTAAAAETGTDTAANTISAKVLADEIDRRIAAAITP